MKKKWYARKTVWAAVAALVTLFADLMGLPSDVTVKILIAEAAIGAIFMRAAIESVK